jgi:hypothetical protein
MGVPQYSDRIIRVNPAVIVGIRGVETRRRSPFSNQETEEKEGVRTVNPTIVVGIPAHKATVRRDCDLHFASRGTVCFDMGCTIRRRATAQTEYEIFFRGSNGTVGQISSTYWFSGGALTARGSRGH